MTPLLARGVGGAEGGGPWNEPPISPGVGGAEGGRAAFYRHII